MSQADCGFSCCERSAQVILNPPVELADMPLKSFYRYSLPDTTGAVKGYFYTV